jgi:hypothetical protein
MPSPPSLAIAAAICQPVMVSMLEEITGIRSDSASVIWTSVVTD